MSRDRVSSSSFNDFAQIQFEKKEKEKRQKNHFLPGTEGEARSWERGDGLISYVSNEFGTLKKRRKLHHVLLKVMFPGSSAQKDEHQSICIAQSR